MGRQTTLSEDDTHRLLAGSFGKRVSSAHLSGRRVWLKRFDAEARPFFKTLHGRLSPLMPAGLRSSPLLDAADATARETRKAAAFRKAGFPTPRTLHEAGTAIVMSDAAPSLESELARLRDDDPAAHDSLLVAMAGALGKVHAAGLCHGRPHPRDMFLKKGAIGFLDFEEEPEAAMPLAAAQARDALLLFMHVGGHGIDPMVEKDAVAIYLEHAPAETLARLRRLVGFFRLFVPILRVVRRIRGLGGDGRRLLEATLLLREALSVDRPHASGDAVARPPISRTRT